MFDRNFRGDIYILKDNEILYENATGCNNNEEIFENYAMYYEFVFGVVRSILALDFVYGKLQEDNLRYICFAGWKTRIGTSGNWRTKIPFWFGKWKISSYERQRSDSSSRF